MSRQQDLKNPGRRLPKMSLVSARTGEAHVLRDHSRSAPAIVLAHGDGCRQCEAFIAQLACERQSIHEWDGEVVVVRSGVTYTEGGKDRAARAPFPVLLDPDERLVRALSIDVPALVVADQWGVLHAVEEAGPEHRFISPSEIAEWVKYLAVQCPECEGESM